MVEKCKIGQRTERKTCEVGKNRRKANWIGHILHRNCLLKHVMEEKIDGKRRRGRRCEQLLDDVLEERRYRTVKQEALDYTVCSSLWKQAVDVLQDRVRDESISRNSGKIIIHAEYNTVNTV